MESLPEQGCDRLILLGDIFHVWVGFPQFESEDVVKFLKAVRRLRDRGVPVDYVEGNRDFFLREGPYASSFDRIVDELDLEVGGQRVLAVHGDGINDRDYQYRFWHWVSKSSPVRFAMRYLPKSIAHRMVAGTERRLGDSNFKHKREIPRTPILNYARRRFREGFEVLIMGHFHEERYWELEEGAVLIFDAWFKSRTIEWMPRVNS